jgi:GAF domain-containing protein
MVDFFRRALSGVSEDPDIAQRQYLLNVILLGLAGPSLIFGIIMLILWQMDITSPFGAIAGLGVQPFYILAYWLGRRGNISLAGYIPATVVFVLMVSSLFQSGIGHISTIGFAMVVVTAGILIGAGAATIFVLLSLGAYVLVGWAQLNGLIPTALPALDSIVVDALGLGLGLSVLVIFNWISTREMKRALGLERDLTNRLQVQSHDLEEQITQRTQSLERNATQLETTAEIARLSSEMLDPLVMMSQAVELIRRNFKLYNVSIYLLDETGNWANLAASSGESGKALIAQHHRLAVGSASVIGWVTSNRLPRMILDVSSDPFFFSNPLLPYTRSEVAVPLIVGSRLLGAMDFQSNTANTFSEDDLRAIEAIGGELAIAIDSARLIRETQMQLERFEASYRDLAHQSWSRIAGAPEETSFRVGAPSVGSPQGNDDFLTLDQAESSGQTVLSEDGLEIAVPVEMRGEVIASIGARKDEDDDPWSEEDIALLRAVAGQTALALESARQYTEEHRRVAELEVINRVSQAVSQHLRLDSLYRVVHAQINQVLGKTDMYIGLYDAEAEEISFPYVSENNEVIKVDPIKLGDGLPALIIRTQQPLLLQEDTQRRVKALGSEADEIVARSWLGVPLLTGEDIIGVIVVQDFEEEHRFNDDDAALMSTIASQVATALQNAQLMDHIQRSARRERLIHEITSKVRRAPDMNTILETTARELNRAMNATSTSIQLKPRPSQEPGQVADEDQESRSVAEENDR